MTTKLVIHLGLPKTGTTALQTWFFPQVEGYLGKVGIQKNVDSEQVHYFPIIKKALRPKELPLQKYSPEDIRQLVKKLPLGRFPTILISEENLSIWKESTPENSTILPVQKPVLGEETRKGSHPMVHFLRALQKALPDDVTLVTVLSLRAQKTYLPSQAAQVGERRMGPIIRRIIRRKDEFILWDKLVQDLVSLRGPEQHLTLLYEDGLTAHAREIARFCGLTPKNRRFNFSINERVNERSSEIGSSWKFGTRPEEQQLNSFTGKLTRLSKQVFRRDLPGISRAYLKVRRWLLRAQSDRGVRLSARDEALLQKFTSASNHRLAKHLGREIRNLGYD